MKAEQLLDAMEQIDDALILQAREEKVGRRWVKALGAAACVCVILTGFFCLVTLWKEQEEAKNVETIQMTQQGVVIPPMQVHLPENGEAYDMVAFFIYEGRSYVMDGQLYHAQELAGEYVGTATASLNEWSTPNDYVEGTGSVSGAFYELNGYDKSFILCMKQKDGTLDIYVNNNGLTLKTGAELYEQRLHLAENYVAGTVQTRADWYYESDVSFCVDVEEPTLTAFVQALNEGMFLPRADVPLPEGKTDPFEALECYHLFLQMENGMCVHLRLWEGGYVIYSGLSGVCVQIEQAVFNAFVAYLDNLCQKG